MPRSITAPVANLNITFAGGVPNRLPAGQVFTTKIGAKTYNFTNTEAVQQTFVSRPHIQNMEVKEGVLRTVSYVVQILILIKDLESKDDAMDTKTISVTVTKSFSDNTGLSDVWSIGTNAVVVDGSSNVYFVEEDYDGAYSLSFFGDGVIGKKLEAGNIVTVTYLQTKGAEANGAGSTDTEDTPAFAYNNNTVSVASAAKGGGSEKESISSIRFNAPKAFASQNRAVTSSDFEALVNNNFQGFSLSWFTVASSILHLSLVKSS